MMGLIMYVGICTCLAIPCYLGWLGYLKVAKWFSEYDKLKGDQVTDRITSRQLEDFCTKQIGQMRDHMLVSEDRVSKKAHKASEIARGVEVETKRLAAEVLRLRARIDP